MKKTITRQADCHVGSKIRERRTILGISQQKLADHLGITFQQVQKYENATNRIGSGCLYDVSQFLKVDIGYFYPESPEDLKKRQIFSKDSVQMITAYESLSPKFRKSLYNLTVEMGEM